ncbi:hypothetical protein NHX12_015534 [Muraenolepis orangiensis]|uniref:G-protein coupled receptors family 2 profile 2 domain-containing protein n=1 Tax=Muraenolepis orangiensis TaxID=630683 RepID=A0A9Q0D9Y1_9TELE|nr:hypothetical protein NHX12_015534 [Muraenolepis orangiensis]
MKDNILTHFQTLKEATPSAHHLHSCQRITLHKNLFFSFVLNSGITIIWFTTTFNHDHKQGNPVSYKVAIGVLVVSSTQVSYKGSDWLCPLLSCWIRSDTSLLYIIHSPICAALVVNFFFLLNIVRVLITKLKVTHQAESSLYMKAVRATLILIPLLGIQFVLLPYKHQGHCEVYQYIMNIFMHFQGLLVATIFCFFNGEVQTVLRRHWNQQRMQLGGSFSNAEVFRSASYVASSLTEVHRCYSIESHTEYLNGKNYLSLFL